MIQARRYCLYYT